MTNEVLTPVTQNEKSNDEWKKSFIQNILFIDKFLEIPEIVQKDDFTASSAHREMKAVTVIGFSETSGGESLTLDRFASKMEIARTDALELIGDLLDKRVIYLENATDENEDAFTAEKVIDIKLTKLGLDMYEFFVNDIQERAAQLASGLSDIEKEVFARVIEKLYRGVSEQSV
ncbi:MAG: hypothetical protein Q4F84_10525 [Fibrobacter sp.]|nr:hypothetical protein [Fibrobacter sp.]